MTAVTDKELLKMIQQGSPEESEAAFAGLWGRYHRLLLEYARSRGVPHPEDIASEVWILALQQLDDFEWRDISLDRWLLSVTRHMVLSYFRTRAHEETELEEYARDYSADFGLFLPEERGPDEINSEDGPDEILEDEDGPRLPNEQLERGKLIYIDVKRDVDRVLHEAMKELTKKERQYIIARYWLGSTSEVEAAEILNISPGYARQLKYRVIEKLRKNEELVEALKELSWAGRQGEEE